MKLPVLFRSAAAAAVAILFSSCIEIPVEGGYGPSYGGGGYPARPDYPASSGSWSQARRDAWQSGYRRGADDKQDGDRYNADRYAGSVAAPLREEFRNGYSEGYRSAERQDDRVEGPKTYQNGYRRGQEDARARRSSNWRRHTGNFPQRYEDSFRKGYEQGYGDATPSRPSYGSGGSGQIRVAYTSGFSYGESDARLGRRPDYRRHEHYTRMTESAFSEGYMDGYSRRRSRY